MGTLRPYGNAWRVRLVEYIVSSAFNSDNKCRIELYAYDVLTDNDIKIEAKTSG